MCMFDVSTTYVVLTVNYRRYMYGIASIFVNFTAKQKHNPL